MMTARYGIGSVLPGVVLSTLLAGCISLGSDAVPQQIAELSPQITPDPTWPRVDSGIVIVRPVADQMRGSNRIIVNRGPARLTVYPGVSWLDSTPNMLQSILVQAYSDSGRFRGVAQPGGARAPVNLVTSIRRFEAVEQADGSLVVSVEIDAGLVQTRTSDTLASRLFTESLAVVRGDIDSLVHGFQVATGALIAEMIGWTLEEMAATEPPE